MLAPTLMVGAALPGSDRDVWTGEVGSLQWASRQALGAHQRALGALIAVIGSREITARIEPGTSRARRSEITGARNEINEGKPLTERCQRGLLGSAAASRSEIARLAR
jgi:hypothetical protein